MNNAITATTTNASATTPDIVLVITDATTASGTDVPASAPAISDDKVLYAPATTPVRWLRAISQKMGVSLWITPDQAGILAGE